MTNLQCCDLLHVPMASPKLPSCVGLLREVADEACSLEFRRFIHKPVNIVYLPPFRNLRVTCALLLKFDGKL